MAHPSLHVAEHQEVQLSFASPRVKATLNEGTHKETPDAATPPTHAHHGGIARSRMFF